MSTTPFRLERLEIRRDPGHPRGGPLLEALRPGVNLVFGPNGSGKTSLVRAALLLLGAPRSGTGGLELGAVLRRGERRWELFRDEDGLRVLLDGKPVSSPLPEGLDPRRHALSLHGLLVAQDGDLAEALLREAAGGFDLNGAARSLGFEEQQLSANRAEFARHRDARREMGEVEARHRSLMARFARRDELEERIEKAKSADAERRRLVAALRRIDLEERLAAHEDAGRVFPPCMPSLAGNEDRLLDELAEDLERLRRESRQVEGALQEALELVARGEVFENRRDGEGEIARLRAEIGRLRHLRDEEGQHRRMLHEARGRRDRALRDLGFDPARLDAPSSLETDPALVDLWRDATREEDGLRARNEGLDELETWLRSHGARRGDEAALASAVESLRLWSRAPSSRRVSRRRVVAGLLLLFLASLAALRVPPMSLAGSAVPPWALPALVALGALIWCLVDGADERERIRRLHEIRRLPLPRAWDEDGVEELRRRLVAEWDESRLAARLEERWKDLPERRRSLDEAREKLLARLEELPGWNTTLAGTRPLRDVFAVEAIVALRRSVREVKGLEELLAATSADGTTRAEALAASLRAFGVEGGSDAETLHAALELVERRMREHEGAVRRQRELARRKTAIAAEREAMERRRRNLFERLALSAEDPRDEETLRKACAARPDWSAWNAEGLRIRHELDGLAELLGEPVEGTDAPRPTREELALALVDAETRAESLTDLVRTLGALDADVERTCAGTELEDATLRLDEATDEIEKLREATLDRAVGAILVRHVERRTRESKLPPVFRRARALFLDVTRGRFDLRVGSGSSPRFLGLETASGRLLELDDLSSATRLQLLLALRTAYLEEREGDSPLPLFLDETLGNTDDERAVTVIAAFIALARRGRQIFYLSARRDEIESWKTELEKRDDLPWALHEIGPGTRGARRGKARSIAVDESWPPPVGDLDHAAYGERLAVPPLDPWGGVDAVHLWALTEDPRRLRQILEVSHCETWAALKALVALRENPPEELASALPSLHAAASVMETLLGAWTTGRARPLDSELIRSSRALTPTTMPRILELAERLDWDGAAVLEALERNEVKRFRADKRDELREEWEGARRLPTCPPLSPDEILRAAWARALEFPEALRPSHERIRAWLAEMNA